jgi:hypothetical protein
MTIKKRLKHIELRMTKRNVKNNGMTKNKRIFQAQRLCNNEKMFKHNALAMNKRNVSTQRDESTQKKRLSIIRRQNQKSKQNGMAKTTRKFQGRWNGNIEKKGIRVTGWQKENKI